MDKRAAVVTVTEKENTGGVVVPKGNLLAVTLPIVPGTGYGWRIVGVDAKSLELVNQSMTPATTSMPGATEQQVFVFRARGAGSTSLTLEYARSWERTKPAAKTYNLTVDVR